jgi:hypothetical protein
LQQPFAGKTWACECGERIEPQFAACWQCGAQAPEPQVRSGQPASE